MGCRTYIYIRRKSWRNLGKTTTEEGATVRLVLKKQTCKLLLFQPLPSLWQSRCIQDSGDLIPSFPLVFPELPLDFGISLALLCTSGRKKGQWETKKKKNIGVFQIFRGDQVSQENIFKMEEKKSRYRNFRNSSDLVFFENWVNLDIALYTRKSFVNPRHPASFAISHITLRASR